MGLTSSLYTGLSGLNANSQLITVSGNNIANVNTVGYKSNRIDFQTQISQTLSSGSAPTASLGGTNPTQVGLGVQLGATSRDFRTGSLQPTGNSTDMAIEGNGFFVLDVNGERRYTRDGSFKLDRDNHLASADGGLVQGNPIDAKFNVVEGMTGPITIPIGELTIAQATSDVAFAGTLNAGGTAATLGSINQTEELHSAASSAAGANDATGATLLSSLYDTSGTVPLFASGDIITVSGVTKGGATLPDHTFAISATAVSGADDYGTTVQDFNDFLTSILGVDTSAGGGAGVTINGGQITVTSNTGTANAIALDGTNIIRNAGTASAVSPLTMTTPQSANGESARTTFAVYDSLGNAVTVDLSVVLEGKSNTGTTWRYYVQSEGDAGLSRILSTGQMTYDTSGRLVAGGDPSISINRSGTGSATPQFFKLDFGSTNALSNGQSSTVSASKQDGAAAGTLESFDVDGSGLVIGKFSNSLSRDLGRVQLAMFTNPQGLADMGNNVYAESINSGTAQIVSPTSNGSGKIVGSTLEQSNVDLSNEFINLVAASTGFSASSRVLSTSNQLIQELLSSIR